MPINYTYFLFVAATLSAAACKTTAGSSSHAKTLSSQSEGIDSGAIRPASDSDAAQSRSQCNFSRGALPAATIGAELPIGSDIPVEHIIVLMQENRSFDSYFGHLGKYLGRTDIEAASDDTSVPEDVSDPSSPRHHWVHAPMLCLSDTNHEWAGSHLEYDNGKMDGFYQANNGFYEKGQPVVPKEVLRGDRAMWWYDEHDIPYYYDLAKNFAIGDHYFSSVIGPTYTNRDYLYAGTSRGTTTNVQPNIAGLSAKENLLIFDELSQHGVSWAIYTDSIHPGVGTFVGSGFVSRWLPGLHIWPLANYYLDAKLGNLPKVAFIDLDHVDENVTGNDEHPPSDIQIGQSTVAGIISNLFSSPNWASSALFLVYDEHGGLYDHVVPPKACAPDALEPILADADDQKYPAHFDQYGFRVPFIVVSPFAKRGYVGHGVYDHTSIIRFIEARFDLPALTARDANADALYDFFDFSRQENPPPPEIAKPAIDPYALDRCKLMYSPHHLFTDESGMPHLPSTETNNPAQPIDGTAP